MIETPTDIGSMSWARIHGYARPVRVLSASRTRCWVAWRTSTGADRVQQVRLSDLTDAPEPGIPVQHAAPPALSRGLIVLDAELRRRRLRSEHLARHRAQRDAERAARMAS